MNIKRHLLIRSDATFFVVFPSNPHGEKVQKQTAHQLGMECLYASRVNQYYVK